MLLLFILLAFAGIAVNTNELDTSFTSQEILESQINAAIKYMCINQYESNGRFLYTVYLREDKIEIDPEENNMPRQAGGLYGVGMYYRLNYYNHNNNNNNNISITHCIHNSMTYLSGISIPIIINGYKQNGQLIDGNTGATSLAILGMIEICIVDYDICIHYVDEFVSWINGLITMRNQKLVNVDDKKMKSGAFAKKLKKSSKSSDFYDGEGYVAFARMMKYKKRLFSIIGNKIDWKMIINIINGLDEYFIKNRHQDNPHWFVQSWFDRWVTFNSYLSNNAVNKFNDHYMVYILMKGKIEEEFKRIEAFSHYKSQPSCYLLEASIDVLYAIKYVINNSKYNNTNTIKSLKLFQNDLWDRIIEKYQILSKKQLFEDEVDFYFESRLNGAILTGNKAANFIRIDDTQHCVCTLMKLNSFLYHTNDTKSYYANLDQLLFVDNGINRKNYNVIFGLSLISFFVIIASVYIIWFYWRSHHQKQQKKAYDLLLQ